MSGEGGAVVSAVVPWQCAGARDGVNNAVRVDHPYHKVSVDEIEVVVGVDGQRGGVLQVRECGPHAIAEEAAVAGASDGGDIAAGVDAPQKWVTVPINPCFSVRTTAFQDYERSSNSIDCP